MNILNASKIVAAMAVLLFSSVLTVQAFDAYPDKGGDTYYSEFVGGDCTLEQEQQARDDAKAAISRQVAITPLEDEEGLFYSEWVGGYVAMAEEDQAMEAGRIAMQEKTGAPAGERLDIGLGYTPLDNQTSCSYSEWHGREICR